MDLSERGRNLERLIEGSLGLNKSQATEKLREHFGRFDYKTLSRLYAGTGRVQTLMKVEQWAEDQLRLRAEGAGDEVEVTGQSEKHIAFKFRGVKGYGIEDVEVVVPIEYADLGREAVRDLMREVMRGSQRPEKSDLEDPET